MPKSKENPCVASQTAVFVSLFNEETGGVGGEPLPLLGR